MAPKDEQCPAARRPPGRRICPGKLTSADRDPRCGKINSRHADPCSHEGTVSLRERGGVGPATEDSCEPAEDQILAHTSSVRDTGTENTGAHKSVPSGSPGDRFDPDRLYRQLGF